MKTAYFDCIGGIAGDMTLAALLDAGAPIEAIDDDLRRMPITGWELSAEPTQIGVMAALRVKVNVTEPQPGRHLKEINAMITGGEYSSFVTETALLVFHRLAEAEAAVHGETLDSVHFHEVGAVDAVVDIVGSCLALEKLGVERVVCSPLPIGRGLVECSHGLIPLPGPAVGKLLQGAPTYGIEVEGETVTPTGAALAVGLAERFGPQPPMRWISVGYGAGWRQSDRPNLLRVFIGDGESTPERIAVLETNLDDMTPQAAGFLMERLLAEGALDAYFTPVQMKKNRPGMLLTVLCEETQREPLTALILRESTSLGVRFQSMERTVLNRRIETVETPYGPIRVKRAEGAGAAKISPEFDDCRAAALKHGATLADVQAAALKAYHSQ